MHHLWANMHELDSDMLMLSTFDHKVKRIRVTPCATHREQQGGNDGGGGVPDLEAFQLPGPFSACTIQTAVRPSHSR